MIFDLNRIRSMFGLDMIPNQFIKDRVIFIHVPKCAGTSLSINWLGYQVGHKTFREYQSILGKKLQLYYVFSLIRNPVDRFMSAYSFLSAGGISSDDLFFRNKNHGLFQNNPNDLLWSLKRKRIKYHHFQSMSHYLVNSKYQLSLNFVHKLEDEAHILREHIQANTTLELGEKIVRGLDNNVRKNSRKGGSKVDFSDLDLDLIYEIYREDFWRFDYGLPSKN